MTSADWVNWWCGTWHWAHPGWHAQMLSAQGLEAGACDAVARSRQADLLASLGVVPSQPPVLDANVVLWLSLNTEQRQQALVLAKSICCAAVGAEATVSVRHDLWCRSLAKALRPGLWLDPQATDMRPLLGAWLGPMFWPRLRLGWAPGDVGELATDLPPNKLETLWRAVLWRVSTP
nr:type III secretion protein [Pseudomonas caspiana]